ncbi:MAG TPA: GntR family transcriptional regulator [Azospirillaceae bacterium]|nr:GntR family transcriptional regulator [Azospirillaceae bacterium]
MDAQPDWMANSDRDAIDERSPTPLYHQLYVILREKILNGTFAYGDQLPSEHELSREFNVSRITVKRALDDLAAARLVVRQRGRGTHVTHQYQPQAVKAPLGGLIDSLTAYGRKTAATLLEFGRETPPPHIAHALNLGVRSPVLRVVRVRSMDGVPFSHLTSYTVSRVGDRFTRADFEGTLRLAVFEGAGVKIKGARQTLSATLADSRVAGLLKVDVGAPLLVLTRLMVDENDEAFDHLTVLYRPDMFQYQIELTRTDQGQGHWAPAIATTE